MPDRNVASTSHPKMPEPEVYEQEYEFWPWGLLLNLAIESVIRLAPENAFVLDYMCGTGYLLGHVLEKRGDICTAGCTLEPRTYVDYAKKRYPGANVEFCDVFEYRPDCSPDVVVCTAGIHHLNRGSQAVFIEKVASELKDGGLFIIGDELVRSYFNEKERRLAVLEVNDALLRYAIQRGAPDSIIEAGIDLISNDIFERGEYKIDFTNLLRMIEENFVLQEINWTWRNSRDSQWGDVLITCRKK